MSEHYLKMGVATQCLKAKKCNKANPQYWANVMLKFVSSFRRLSIIVMDVTGSMQSLGG